MNRRMPDFLGIGGTRCGTTWLHEQLRTHPQLWLPPVKELHYFDRSTRYASPSHLAHDGLRRRLSAGDDATLQWHHEARRDLLRAPRHPSTAAWKLRYYLGRPDDDWYTSLFPRRRGLLRGEITPSYSLLTPADVARVHSLMPDAKLLFLVRDPVERAWSGFRRKGLTDDEIRARLDRPAIDRRTDYLTTLDTWSAVFPRDQLFVGFFDDITADPARLLTDVLTFLGVDAGPQHIPADLHRRVNAARAVPMPADVRASLTRKHLPLLRALSDRLGGHATTWLATAQRTLGSDSAGARRRYSPSTAGS